MLFTSTRWNRSKALKIPTDNLFENRYWKSASILFFLYSSCQQGYNCLGTGRIVLTANFANFANGLYCRMKKRQLNTWRHKASRGFSLKKTLKTLLCDGLFQSLYAVKSPRSLKRAWPSSRLATINPSGFSSHKSKNMKNNQPDIWHNVHSSRVLDRCFWMFFL